MSNAKTYWMTDAAGYKAFVEGSAERDRWAALGWTETTEPSGDDRVWLGNAETGGRAWFPAAAIETWQHLGWSPSTPPEPVDPTKDPRVRDQPAPIPADAPAASKPASKPTPKNVAVGDGKTEE